MVTKRRIGYVQYSFRFILAKIHMVTKHRIGYVQYSFRFILAKIHMVTKQLHKFLLF